MNELLKEDIEPPLAQYLSTTEQILETANFRTKLTSQAIGIHLIHLKRQMQFSCINFSELSEILDISEVDNELAIMKDLMHKALMNRISTNYLYQYNSILGSTHYKTPVSKGLEIIQDLSCFTSSYAVPHFVINTTEGVKTSLPPEYYQRRDGDYVIMKNFEQKTYKYYNTI